MNPGTLAAICDIVEESRPSISGRLLDAAFAVCVAVREATLERLMCVLFPPATLQGLGAVDSDTFGYHYRQTRDLSYDAPTPKKYTYGARLGDVVEGEAAPVYQRGTRASRAAQRE